MKAHRLLFSAASLLMLLTFALPLAMAADPPAKPAVRTKLPTDHPYQRELRDYLGSLTAKDFDHGVTEPPTAVAVNDPDELYRTWLLTLDFPRVGRKRSYPSINLPADQFTLAAIENPETGVMRPACWPEPTVWLANWNYKGNPYYGSRALKLRAFSTITVLMLMTDDLQEHPVGPKDSRSDWFGPQLVADAYTYHGVRDVLPANVRAAFETCLKKMMQRVVSWGPRVDETHFDICALLGMRLAADDINDAETRKLAKDYARRVFSDERLYNPAGFFPEQGGFDGGFQGLSLYWATWLAAAAPDWDFVQDAVKKTWRLRSYLILPEPDGALVGPSHFNTRLSGDVVKDQWDFPFRAVTAAFLTDDAACQAPFPNDEQLRTAPEKAVSELRAELAENPGFLANDKLRSHPWAWNLWPDSSNFPMNNYAHDYYPNGYFAHRESLASKNSPLLKYPFARGNAFTEAFGNTFLIARRAGFGVILHSGNLPEFPGGDHMEFAGPYGLSGGSLSAFWTPATGTVILGRRGGMPFPNQKPNNFDTADLWRTWPVHAVTGVTAAGNVFTSARIQKPQVTYDMSSPNARVRVAGAIPAVTMGKEKSLEGTIEYVRTFQVDEKGLNIETTISGDGKDQVAELYEVLPVFLREAERQLKATPTTIEFLADGKWAPATNQANDKVEAVRLTRFSGAVQVRFDHARRVKLSPAEWSDKFIGHATCRNVLIDLLDSDNHPAGVKAARVVKYRIEAVTP